MSNSSKKHRYNWLPDFVYGGSDGAVTTFAVVAGVAGAQLGTAIVLILGFANLFADGFSMAVGKYQSDHAERERIHKVRERLDEAIHKDPKKQREVLRKILNNRGFKGEDLNRAVRVISANEAIWVDTIMHHKYHLIDEHIYPIKGGVATFIAFNIVGFVPLAAYVFNPFLNFDERELFLGTCFFTLVALFGVGVVKARVIKGRWFMAGLGTMTLGGFAAFISYMVGFLLRNIGA